MPEVVMRGGCVVDRFRLFMLSSSAAETPSVNNLCLRIVEVQLVCQSAKSAAEENSFVPACVADGLGSSEGEGKTIFLVKPRVFFSFSWLVDKAPPPFSTARVGDWNCGQGLS
jgi:hypothetical protein